MVSEIVRWVRQPKIWRFVGFVSAVAGLLCYALSSSFNHLFGNWNLLKIILYTFFSFIICLAILFANKWQNSPSLRMRAHLVFSVFTITTVYSYFFDKVNGKPDVYSLVSGAAFAIMSLGLSKQSHFGFEVDLLYFFCGYLTLQFMKIKLFLVIAGAIFSYPLIILRFYLHVPTEYSEELTNTADYHVVQIDGSQVNFDSLVAPDFDAFPDSLTLVSQINSPSQQVNIGHISPNTSCWLSRSYITPSKKLNPSLTYHGPIVPFIRHNRSMGGFNMKHGVAPVPWLAERYASFDDVCFSTRF
uniref:Uncharacterized protein n=1 Tax=Medicago truncatula TaxID=3880 RepID=I3T0F1_MEDTR|nr:unknown [Medicago truncatula]